MTTPETSAAPRSLEDHFREATKSKDPALPPPTPPPPPRPVLEAKVEIPVSIDFMLPTDPIERVEWVEQHGATETQVRVMATAPLRRWAEAGANIRSDGTVSPLWGDQDSVVNTASYRYVLGRELQAAALGLVSQRMEAGEGFHGLELSPEAVSLALTRATALMDWHGGRMAQVEVAVVRYRGARSVLIRKEDR